MEANNSNYNIENSSRRIDDILSFGAGNNEHVDEIPGRDDLNYKNGCYVDVGALFIDIRNSSGLTEVHRKPALSKLYRSFISECIAVINSNENCREISISGDCVWGVFNGKTKLQVQSLFYTAAKLNSLIKMLNKKFEKKGIETITVGIGLDIGNVLMVQAGFKGSGLNDVVWMGDVVNNACHYADMAGKDGNLPIVISPDVYCNITERDQNFMIKMRFNELYHGNVIMSDMDKWIDENV